jgi:hypothetical protein
MGRGKIPIGHQLHKPDGAIGLFHITLHFVIARGDTIDEDRSDYQYEVWVDPIHFA